MAEPHTGEDEPRGPRAPLAESTTRFSVGSNAQTANYTAFMKAVNGTDTPASSLSRRATVDPDAFGAILDEIDRVGSSTNASSRSSLAARRRSQQRAGSRRDTLELLATFDENLEEEDEQEQEGDAAREGPSSPQRRDTLKLLNFGSTPVHSDRTAAKAPAQSGNRRDTLDFLQGMRFDDEDEADVSPTEEREVGEGAGAEASSNASPAASNTGANEGDTSNLTPDVLPPIPDTDSAGASSAGARRRSRRATLDLLNMVRPDESVQATGPASSSTSMSMLGDDSADTMSPTTFAAMFSDESGVNESDMSTTSLNNSTVSRAIPAAGTPDQSGTGGGLRDGNQAGQQMLRSALRAPPLKSAMKKGRYSVQGNRNVAFGSPTVAEFNRDTPPMSMRKLSSHDAKMLFSMEPENGEGAEAAEEDAVTALNSSVLDSVGEYADSSSDEEDRRTSRKRRLSRSVRRSSIGASGRRRRRSQEGDHTMVLDEPMDLDSDEELQEGVERIDAEISFNMNSSRDTNAGGDGSSSSSSSDDDSSDAAGDSESEMMEVSFNYNMSRSRFEESPASATDESGSEISRTEHDMSLTQGLANDSVLGEKRVAGPGDSHRQAAGKRMKLDASMMDESDLSVEHTMQLGTLGDLLSGKSPAPMEPAAPRSQGAGPRRTSTASSVGADVTVELGTLGDLIEEASGPKKGGTRMLAAPVISGNDEHTVELEDRIGDLLEGDGDAGDDAASPRGEIGRDGGGGSRNAGPAVGASAEDRTVELEGGIGDLLRNVANESPEAGGEPNDDSFSDTSNMRESLTGDFGRIAAQDGRLAWSSPSTPAPPDLDGRGAAPSSRTTPVPQVLSIQEVAARLNIPEVFDENTLDGQSLNLLIEELGEQRMQSLGGPLVARREALAKFALELEERRVALEKTLGSKTFRTRLQFFRAKIQSSAASAGLFVRFSRAEAEAQWAMMALVIEEAHLSQLKSKLAELEFDEKMLAAREREISAQVDAAAATEAEAERVASLHTELSEQVEVLQVFQTDLDTAVATRDASIAEIGSLERESEQLRARMDRHEEVTKQQAESLRHLKELEEVHDVCRNLSAWQVYDLSTSGTRLCYIHPDGSSHTVLMQPAAAAPAVVCKLAYEETRSGTPPAHNAGLSSCTRAALRHLLRAAEPRWESQVANCHNIQELRSCLISLDLEMARLHSLIHDIRNVENKYVIGDDALHFDGLKSKDGYCAFEVHFVSRQPTARWVVDFEIGRGYPFGEVTIVPRAEFGLAPEDVQSLCDVNFGYGRLLRACDYLDARFQQHCQTNQ